MGHKVHPKVFRIGTTTTWDSKWYAKRGTYQKMLREDILIKEFISKKLKAAGLQSVEIERRGDALTAVVNAAKPGVVIGKSGAGADSLKKDIQKEFWKNKKVNFNINIFEVKKPSLSARIMVQGMVEELEKRVAFRRVMKQTRDKVKKAGAQGVKIVVSGRLNGAEIARTEKMIDGKVPLQNLRADIDYATGTARTLYGAIGVKLWIYRGEIFNKKKAETEENKK
jgi:small subunit ribosomal protein S3